MRQRRMELMQRVFIGGGLERMLTRKHEILDDPLGISQGAGFDEMVRDLAPLVHGADMGPLERLCYLQVQTLTAWEGETRKQGLPHQFVGKGEGCLGSLGARLDQPPPLCLLKGGQQFVDVYWLKERLEQGKTEVAADHRSR